MISSHPPARGFPNTIRRPRRRGFSLLLALFVLTLVGITLLTVGGHFTQTARYAQSARLEALATQILHSGLAWAKVHHSELSDASGDAPILLDAASLAGQGTDAKLSLAKTIDKKSWRLTVRLERGRAGLTRSAFFHPPSSESNGADSR